MAKVTTEFMGAKDGEVYPTQFKPGDIVEGDLAAVAVREGWAEEDPGQEEKKLNPPANKAVKGAPENK